MKDVSIRKLIKILEETEKLDIYDAVLDLNFDVHGDVITLKLTPVDEWIWEDLKRVLMELFDVEEDKVWCFIAGFDEESQAHICVDL